MVGPVISGPAVSGVFPPCPGRTWFQAIVEGWHDQGMMRKHLDGLHQRDLARAVSSAAVPPVLEVTVADLRSPVRKYTVDPQEGTVAFTVTGPQEYLQATGDTANVPAVRDTAELDIIP